MTRLRRASAALAALLAAAALGACGGDDDDGTDSPINTNTPAEGDEVPAPDESQRDFGEEE